MFIFEELAQQPIPVLKAPTGWQEVPIKECGEPLIALSSLQNQRLVVEPEYFQEGLPHSLNDVYVRKGVADKLLQVASQLPTGFSLVAWDAWRPLEIQTHLFDKQCGVLRQRFPSLSSDEIQKQAQIYVSMPSNDPCKPSPHYTGGAIDLTIAGPDAQPLVMETGFDSFTIRSRTRVLEEYIEKGNILTQEQREWLYNRRFLYHVMTACGFTNYWEEWWHYDYGDQFWGSVSSTNAIYGGTTLQNHVSSR